jgi:uncharacterized membrane protein YgcG
MRSRSSVRALSLAGLLTLAAAAPAAADSIAYVRGGDVWLATPDGARQHQVTRDGGYTYVSQADDGTLIAKHGMSIRRLNRADGAVTADFSTPVSATPPGAAFEFKGGPIDPVISPDGTRIAYGYNAQYTQYDPYCGYYGGCTIGKLIVGTGYSRADRSTGWDEPGFKQHSGWQWPSWIDNDHTLISHPVEILNKQFWIDTVGDDRYGQEWFRDDGRHPTAYDAELNRQQTGLVAAQRNEIGRHQLLTWKLTAPPPAEPADCLTVSAEAGEMTSPSWSPGGSSLAFADERGVVVVDGLDLAGCDPAKAGAERVLAPGGSAPDWGPAGVPAGSSAGGGAGGRAGGGGGGGGGGGNGGGGGGSGGRALAVTVPRGSALRLATALRRGLLVGVSTRGAGRVTATARAGGAVVASGSARIGAGGRGRVRLLFTRAGRRALARAGRARLALRVRFQAAAGGAAEQRSAAVVVKR